MLMVQTLKLSESGAWLSRRHVLVQSPFADAPVHQVMDLWKCMFTSSLGSRVASAA